MRVHIGSDHAGLELKAHLLARLAELGHEPVDHGPFVYDALDDYPVFCLRAAAGVVQDQAAGVEALGVVVGGSGNGEQIAANKVPGVRVGARLVRRDGRASPASTTTPTSISVGGRMHPLEDMTRFVEIFLATPFSGDERHVRRIGMLADYEATGDLPPLPEQRGRPGPADA